MQHNTANLKEMIVPSPCQTTVSLQNCLWFLLLALNYGKPENGGSYSSAPKIGGMLWNSLQLVARKMWSRLGVAVCMDHTEIILPESPGCSCIWKRLTRGTPFCSSSHFPVATLVESTQKPFVVADPPSHSIQINQIWSKYFILSMNLGINFQAAITALLKAAEDLAPLLFCSFSCTSECPIQICECIRWPGSIPFVSFRLYWFMPRSHHMNKTNNSNVLFATWMHAYFF